MTISICITKFDAFTPSPCPLCPIPIFTLLIGETKFFFFLEFLLLITILLYYPKICIFPPPPLPPPLSSNLSHVAAVKASLTPATLILSM